MALNASESNRTSIRYIPENVWASTPVSGDSYQTRLTSSGIVANKSTTTSEEIRADRMVPDIIEVSASSSGNIDWEFSFGAVDDFLGGFLLSAWSRPMTNFKFSGTAVDVATASTITISGEDATPYIKVGRYIRLKGWTNKANNDYFTVTVVAYAANVTTVTVSETSLVAETGTVNSSITDANDVIIKANTTLRFGTGGLNTIDSNGGNAFSSAIAARQLRVGQRLYVDGLGYEAGTLTFTALPLDGETLTIYDGSHTVVFEFDDNSTVNSGNISVAIGGTFNATAANLTTAINAALITQDLLCVADYVTPDLTITNINTGSGALTGTITNVVVVNFTGGDSGLNGFFTLINVTDDVLTFKETVSTDINASSVPITLKNTHLRNEDNPSYITKQSFTIETGFTDVNKYFLYKGMRPGTFSLTVNAGEIVTGSVEFTGADVSTASVTTLGNSTTYTPHIAPPFSIMNATSNVGALTKDGLTLTTALQSIELNGDGNLREQFAVGSKFARGIGYGRFTLTGSLTAYFETLDFYNNFINHDDVALSWSVTDIEANGYNFSIPAIKITTNNIAPKGIDQDILEEIEWEAKLDTTLSAQFLVDKYSITIPVAAKH